MIVLPLLALVISAISGSRVAAALAGLPAVSIWVRTSRLTRTDPALPAFAPQAPAHDALQLARRDARARTLDDDCVRGQALAPRRVVGEERAEVQRSDLLVVRLERFPRLARGQWQHSSHRSSLQFLGCVQPIVR